MRAVWRIVKQVVVPLIIQVKIVNVSVVEDHGDDLRVEVVQHVVGARRGEVVVLAAAPEDGLVGGGALGRV